MLSVQFEVLDTILFCTTFFRSISDSDPLPQLDGFERRNYHGPIVLMVPTS